MIQKSSISISPSNFLKLKYSIAILIPVFGFIVVSQEYWSLRYIKYLIFPTLLAIHFFKPTSTLKIQKIGIDFINYFFLWLIFTLISIVVSSLINGFGSLSITRFTKELYFINTSILSVILLFNIGSHNSILKSLKFFVVIFFVYTFFYNYKAVLITLNQGLVEFLLGSTSPTESYLSPVFGTLTLYFILNKKWKYFLLCLLLTLIGAKRLVIFGVFISIFLIFILHPFKKLICSKLGKQIIPFIAVILNIILCLIIIFLINGYFDQIIFELTGIPANWLFSGRIAMYYDVFNNLHYFPILPNGLGHIGTLLVDNKIHFNDFFEHMHSDILKFYIELGIIFFSVILFFLYRMSLRNFTSFILVVFFNIYMLTDNPSILYEFYLFFHIILLLSMQKGENN